MVNGAGQQRPLSELSLVAQRRNSPVWNQNTKKMAPGNSSPLEVSSSFNASASPRLFWKGRESASPFSQGSENRAPYDPEASFSGSKRPSVENLKKFSRVRNSRIFAHEQNNEYDPSHIHVPQRPLVARGLSQRKSQDGAGRDSQPAPKGKKLESRETSEQPENGNAVRPASPSKDQTSPAKSSLSKGSRFGPKGAAMDPSNEIWLDGNRQFKSVTFDAAPPQINEYEMTTPDPSTIASDSHEGSEDSEEDEGDISFDRDSSIDRDDSFDASLEDIEKTPVVLPEDWRFVSPDNANDDLVNEGEDPFTEHVEKGTLDDVQDSHIDSQDSNAERRPLPPLPSTRMASPRPSSAGRLSRAFDLDNNRRILPSPPASASFGQSESSERELEQASMSLEDKLRLMMLGETGHKNEQAGHEEQHDEQSSREESSAEGERKETLRMEDAREHEDVDFIALDGLSSPRISRESILRDIRKSDSYLDDSYECSSQIECSSIQYGQYDPDFPIQSLENQADNTENSVNIKEEEQDDDIYAIPDYYEHDHDENPLPDNEHHVPDDDDNESRYSRLSTEETREESVHSKGSDDSQVTAIAAEQTGQADGDESTNKDQEEPRGEETAAPNGAADQDIPERPETPQGKEYHLSDEEPSTPGSVIHHSVDDDNHTDESVPDPVATVKAPGGKLKTRPSLTPADVESMAATRRRISGQQPPMPALSKQTSNESQKSAADDSEPETKEALQEAPRLPPPSRKESQRQSSLVKLDIPFSIQEESLGFGLDKEFDRVMETQKVAFEKALSQSRFPLCYTHAATHPQEAVTSQNANTSNSALPTDTYASKQRGYLMRHNTKVIVASSSNVDDEPASSGHGTTSEPRSTRSAGSSPRKASQQTWTTVPWNSQPRRASIKMAGGIPKKKPVPGPVPPLPGHASNVQDVLAGAEEAEPPFNEVFEEGEERGRLFVKVVGIKYLDLPLPKGERSYFSLTLDNGLHCVTTSWLELGKSAPIGQEFELIVQNDLEFQLTLQMKVDESKFNTPEAVTASPTRQKPSTFSRVFASPRKRKEMDLKQQLMMQQQRSNNANPGAWDKLRTLIARDGSFARSYVALSDHEKQAFGRPYTVDVSCFNEWAIDDQPSSIKSKKSTASNCSQRRPPYKIGKLELQLLFVPKPKGAKDEDMPKSMNACVREMRDAESVASRSFEGFLSQQGGDCPYWRRRFFKLQGSKLTAYHETTRQPRATINLAKAAKLIDDRSILTQKETTTKGGGRRKSAFAEEEEGYMFVEEGFRIRFGNGEVIDFYADSAADKEKWLDVLADAVGKGPTPGNGQARAWTELVLKHERQQKMKREADRLLGNSAGTAPQSPPARKEAPPLLTSSAYSRSSMQLPPSASPSNLPRPSHKHAYSQPEARSAEARRQKTRSLMF